MRSDWLNLAVVLCLILSVLVIYTQVRGFEFTGYDDDVYVYENPHVQQGLTPQSVIWAFTAAVSNNWMPVTLLSHLLDVQLFGMRSGMHHLVNVLLHILSSLLLFRVLHRATRARWPSAFCAFIFALHPLHVGSVAWIAERKDVLSGFFWFLGLLAYLRYTERSTARRYLLLAGVFCLGLMSKPTLVTFPFALLLLDFWPLRRAQWPATVKEKLPLFALSLAACVVTFLVQQQTGAVRTLPLLTRVENSLISYLTYLGQMFWPVGLTVFYPYPESIPVWQAAVALVVLAGITALVVSQWRVRRYLAVGWFWYVGTLVPVIGLVQVGMQAHADRYTYLPMIGIAIMLAWGGAEVASRWPSLKPLLVAASIATCVSCIPAAHAQARYWRNDETLFSHALQVTHDNWVAHNNLGRYLMKKPERLPDAVANFKAALRIDSNDPDANNNLGVSLARSRRCDSAIPYFETALRVRPNFPVASSNLASCYLNTGRYADAIAYLETALRLNPDYADAHFNLGLVLSRIPGREADALREYETVLSIRPDAAAHRKIGLLLESRGRVDEALAHFQAAQRIQPDPENAQALNRLRGRN